MALWYLFDSTMRKVANINIALKYLLLEVIGERLGEEEVQFDCFDGLCIWGFGNTWHQNYGIT